MSPAAQASEPPYVLAIDVGTSSVRAILYDRLGQPSPAVRAASGHMPHTTADGGSELDADELVERVLACLDEVVSRCAGYEIAAVALCTVWHSLVGIDAHGGAVTPVIFWADTRPAGTIAALRQELDERAVHLRTGCLFHASYYPAKLRWLRTARPDWWEASRRWISPGEYIVWRLCGELACTYSMASGTGLLNIQSLAWDGEVLEAAGITPAALSPLVDADYALNRVRPEFAARLGPLARVPWFPALGDGACSNVGSGCVTPDRIALMIGTSGAMRVVLQQEAVACPDGLWCYRLDRRRFVVGGALSDGGNLIAWLRQALRWEGSAAEEAALAAIEPDGHGLTVLPFWSGERSPGYAPDAVGAIHGLRLSTRPADIVRAALEAVAYRFSLIEQRLGSVAPGLREIRATGGALLHSPVWMQILADVLGHPVAASTVEEASSRGAALRALESLGLLTDLAEASAPTGDRYLPAPERHALYRVALARQQALYRRLIHSG